MKCKDFFFLEYLQVGKIAFVCWIFKLSLYMYRDLRVYVNLTLTNVACVEMSASLL